MRAVGDGNGDGGGGDDGDGGGGDDGDGGGGSGFSSIQLPSLTPIALSS